MPLNHLKACQTSNKWKHHRIHDGHMAFMFILYFDLIAPVRCDVFICHYFSLLHCKFQLHASCTSWLICWVFFCFLCNLLTLSNFCHFHSNWKCTQKQVDGNAVYIVCVVCSTALTGQKNLTAFNITIILTFYAILSPGISNTPLLPVTKADYFKLHKSNYIVNNKVQHVIIYFDYILRVSTTCSFNWLSVK